MSPEDLFDEIYEVILSARSSVNTPFRFSRNRLLDDRLDFKTIMLRFESLRLDAMAVRPNRSGEVLEGGIEVLRAGIAGLVDDEAFRDFARNLRFRPSPARQRLPDVYREADFNVLDALLLTLSRISQLSAPQSSNSANTALRQVVPVQRLAPAMFDIADGKLVVVRQPATADPEDDRSINGARAGLLKTGQKIIDALDRSNCDPRVIEGFKDLQNLLLEEDNIIQLALMNLGVNRVCKGVAGELPDVLVGAIEGHTTAIGMYVAQFPEWRRFSENAASIDLTPSDIGDIGNAAQSIITKFEETPDIADDEVPRTIIALRALISDPKRASTRAAFAVLRTIENLVSRVYTLGADLLEQTAAKTVSGLSTATSTAIVGGLMALALGATVSLGGVTTKVAEAAWMKTAAEIVKRQIETLGKAE